MVVVVLRCEGVSDIGGNVCGADPQIPPMEIREI